jgi:hypothetical protein
MSQAEHLPVPWLQVTQRVDNTHGAGVALIDGVLDTVDDMDLVLEAVADTDAVQL